MSFSKIKYQDQSYNDFHNRFHKAEQLQEGVRGLIFVGNTRVGKSTLSCAAAGSKMETFYNVKTKTATIRPVDPKYRDLVNDNLSSVTEQPNFFPSKDYAIVDMPGYADSSRFRQLINFHYIREMTKKLKQVRFLMVITIQTVQNEFRISKSELNMMEAFIEMFPDCGEYVSLVVNQVEYDPKKDLKKDMRMFLNQIIIDKAENYYKKYIKNFSAFKAYYSDSINKGDRIFIVRKPVFRQKHQQGDWSEPNKDIKEVMFTICNATHTKFYNTKELNKINVSIFNPGQYDNNKRMLTLFENYYKAIQKNVQKGINVIQSLFLDILKKELFQSKINLSQTLHNFLREFEVRHEKCRHLDELVDCKLVLSAYLQLIDKIWNFSRTYPYDLSKLKQKFQQENVNYDVYLESIELKKHNLVSQMKDIFEGFLRMANQIVKRDVNVMNKQEKELPSLIKEAYSMFERSLEEAFFLWKVTSYTIKVQPNKGGPTEQSPQNQIKELGIVGNICKTIILNITNVIQFLGNFGDDFTTLREPLINFFLTLNPNKYKDLADDSFQKQLINNYQIIKQCQTFFFSGGFNEDQQTEIQNKIKEIKLYFLVIPISPKPNLITLPPILKKLLQNYNIIESKEKQLRVAIKIASILEHQKEFKKAIGLFFHLELYDKVMGLLSIITSDAKNQEALEWYLEMGQEFAKKKHALYFEMCLEKAKSLCYQNVDKLIEVQEQLVRGKFSIKNEEPDKESFENQSLDGKVQYWNWFRINQEISFLSFKEGLHGQIGNIILKKYREKAKSQNHMNHGEANVTQSMYQR